MDWDPAQYTRYADERGRPFLDLLTRIGAQAPSRVVDVGCGPGNLTALLARRWRDALVDGFDSSAEMIAEAQAHATPRLRFAVADATAWRPPPDADVLISNAVLQWIPSHQELLRGWAAGLPAGGWLAVQLPGNFAAPSHALMREVAASPRWAAQLSGVLRAEDPTASPTDYADLLIAAGLMPDCWETTYLHQLSGPDPVLEWVRGTGLRPVLAALQPDEAVEFSAEYAALLRTAYPTGPSGTFLPFRRVFAVGHKP